MPAARRTTAPRRSKANGVPTRTLLVELQDGEKFKLEIPEDFKVTFGTAGGNRGGGYGGKELRIYEAETKQRACFVNVASFRDLSMPMTRLVISESGETRWEDDGDGTSVRTTNRRRSLREVAEPAY